MIAKNKKELWYRYYLEFEISSDEISKLLDIWYTWKNVDTEFDLVKYVWIDEDQERFSEKKKWKYKALCEEIVATEKSSAKKWRYWIVEWWMLVWSMYWKLDISWNDELVEISEKEYNDSMAWKIFEYKNWKVWKMVKDIRKVIIEQWENIAKWNKDILAKENR